MPNLWVLLTLRSDVPLLLLLLLLLQSSFLLPFLHFLHQPAGHRVHLEGACLLRRRRALLLLLP